jgi:hypothetical protein
VRGYGLRSRVLEGISSIARRLPNTEFCAGPADKWLLHQEGFLFGDLA